MRRPHRVARSRPFLRSWGLFTLVLFVMAIAWSLATPIPSGPDEPTQYVKAAAVARGHLTGQVPPGYPDGTVVVRVPGTLVDLYDPRHGCYYAHPTEPAGCGPPLVRVSSRLVTTTTYMGTYPPLYYLFTGLPSLVSSQPVALEAMRGIGALLCSLMLGLAFAAAWTWARSRWLLVGLAVGVTPMALYLASVLNPSGLEVAAAAALWTTGVILVFQQDKSPPGGLVAAFAGSAVVLGLCRPLSAPWVVAIVFALTVMRPARARRLIRARRMQVGLGVVAAGLVLAVGYIAAFNGLAQEKFPLPKGTTTGQILASIVGQLPGFTRQMVGDYGTPNYPAPSAAVIVWFLAAGILVVFAVVVCRRRDAGVLALVVVGVLVVLPLVADFSHARTNGLLWQGRHQYPLAIGIPILAGALLGERLAAMTRRPAALLSSALVFGNLASFYWVYRRYAVGAFSVNPFAHVPGRWQPMVPVVVVVALVVIGTVAYGAMLYAGTGVGGGPGERHVERADERTRTSTPVGTRT